MKIGIPRVVIRSFQYSFAQMGNFCSAPKVGQRRANCLPTTGKAVAAIVEPVPAAADVCTEILSIHHLTNNGGVLVAQVICQPVADFAVVLPIEHARICVTSNSCRCGRNPPATELLTRSEAARPASRQRDGTCVARGRQATIKSILPSKRHRISNCGDKPYPGRVASTPCRTCCFAPKICSSPPFFGDEPEP